MSDTVISPELQAQLDGILSKLDTVSKENAQLAQENKDLKQQVFTLATNGAAKENEPSKEPKIPKPFKVGKVNYQFTSAVFVVPFIKKGHVTASDVLADKTTYDKLQVNGKPSTILNWLIANESGVIEEVTEED